jgi:hypothetical protein
MRNPASDMQTSDSNYFCTAEWHLSFLHSRFCPLIYGLAFRLSTKSGLFYASQVRLAEYFGASRRSVWSAVRELEKLGFLVRVARRRSFAPTVYRVVEHCSWAESHPEQCAKKLEMPWATDNPDLGRCLFSISGGQVKFRPQQIEFLQKQYTDAEIEFGFHQLIANGQVRV